MKKVGLLFFAILLLVGVSSLTAFADVGPKPSLSISVSNYSGGSCYLDLLSRDGGIEYDDLSYRYKESDKELPIYKYNEDGWLATHIRSGILWGELTPTIITETLPNGGSSYSLSSRFSYFGIPKLFKIIIQLKSGELYVSTKEYDVTEYNQSTTIDFVKNMIKVADVNDGCKISGYIMPEVFSASKPSPELYQDFTVEVADKGLKGVTDNKGYFEISGIAKNTTGYKLYVSKPGYLKRIVDITAVQGDLVVNSKETPILIWPGDISKDNKQDGAINMADVMCLAIAFNSVTGDEEYRKDYDLNIDGSVNMSDIMLIAKHFNATVNDYPACVLPKPTLEPTPTKPVPTTQAGIIEAESMVLNDYSEDSFESVSCAKLDSSVGTLSSRFDGDYGFYDISVRYLDEAGGQSKMGLYVQNERLGDTWDLNEDDGKWKIKTFKNVLLDKQFPIMLQANKDGEENCRVDYIETKLVSVPTSTPTPAIITIRGILEWTELEGAGYMVNGYCLGRSGLPGMDKLIGSEIIATGYVPNYDMTFLPGIIFNLISYRTAYAPSATPVVTPVTPTPTPVLTKIFGKLVWNSFEGGFYGVLGYDEDGKAGRYDIGEGLPGIEKGLGSMKFIEITGYLKPDTISFHMWGTPFKLVSYKLIDPTGTEY